MFRSVRVLQSAWKESMAVGRHASIAVQLKSPPESVRLNVMSEVASSAVLGQGVEVDAMARIGEGAVIGENCTIGRLVEVEAGVQVGDRTELRRGAMLREGVRVGSDSTVFENAIIGSAPQDKKYRGERSLASIGSRTVVREGAIVEGGTAHGGGETVVGDGVLLMSRSYVGHDSQIANDCVIANNTCIAGHVVMEPGVNVGGAVGVHQRVRLGRECCIGAHTMIRRDVVPFTVVSGFPAVMRGLNLRRLRRELPSRELAMAHAAFCFLFRDADFPKYFKEEIPSLRNDATLEQRATRLATSKLQNETSEKLEEVVREMTSFIISRSTRGIHLPGG